MPKVNKKTVKLHTKKTQNVAVKTEKPVNPNVSKNCEIYMCDAKDTKNTKSDVELLNDIETIFENSTKLEEIGDKSNNAYSLIIKGYKENRIVIKIPRKKDGSVDSLKYEYTVGCHIRKTLCKIIPNFMKVYGYIHKFDDEYLILQRVLPGNTLRQLVKENPIPEFQSIKSKELLSIVLQVLCSLQVAQNVISFVHYDLHFGNVIIKEDSSAPKEIKYTYNDMSGKTHTVIVPIYNNRIAVIIDYGRTHTSKSALYFKKNPKLFQPYKFLLNRKKVPNTVDIRRFDSVVDAKRFCRILETYINNEYDFSYEYYEDLNEPHDVICNLLKMAKKFKI